MSSNQKYTARISVNGRHTHLGSFDTAEEAARAHARAYLREQGGPPAQDVAAAPPARTTKRDGEAQNSLPLSPRPAKRARICPQIPVSFQTGCSGMWEPNHNGPTLAQAVAAEPGSISHPWPPKPGTQMRLHQLPREQRHNEGKLVNYISLHSGVHWVFTMCNDQSVVPEQFGLPAENFAYPQDAD